MTRFTRMLAALAGLLSVAVALSFPSAVAAQDRARTKEIVVAFAAELATMQTNEEVDALEVLGLPAMDFLVLPRVTALLLMMPLLFVFACLAGLLGGMVVASVMLDLSPAAYMNRTAEALAWTHLGLGAAKSLVFGALIGMVGCYHGLYAQRNAAGVGVATTGAVVTSIVAIIVIDAVFALVANTLGI